VVSMSAGIAATYWLGWAAYVVAWRAGIRAARSGGYAINPGPGPGA
jgi:hypothetical protein